MGPNERPKQCPKKSHRRGTVFEIVLGSGTTSLGGCITPGKVPSDGTTQHSTPGGGTTQCSVNVRRTLAVVPPSVGGGTARARETREEMFLDSKFEST